MLARRLAFALLASALARPSSAQCPEWDPRFAAPAPGVQGSVYATAVFDDGAGPALYLGGQFQTAGGISSPCIVKFDGANWSALGAPGSGLDGPVHALCVFDDGTGAALYAGGEFTNAGGVLAANVARWDGTSWSALGNGLDAACHALTVHDDGSGPALHAGGDFLSAGGVAALRIARWDGSAWTALGIPGSGMNSTVLGLHSFDDGAGPTLYAGGVFTLAGGVPAFRVARWSGGTWSAMGSAASQTTTDVQCFAVFDDGTGPTLYAGGFFTKIGGVLARYVAKWDGSSWSPVGAPTNGTNSQVRALSVFDDGSGPALYTMGNFWLAGGVSVSNVARWDGTSWSALGGPGDGTGHHVYTASVFDDGSGPALYVGGLFTDAGGVSADRVARWDGAWSALPASTGAGSAGVVFALTTFDDGAGPDLYAGGAFLGAGGISAPSIARWDGTSWSALGAPGSGANATILALCVFDDGSGPALYAGGQFVTIGGVSAAHVARWDGASWSNLGAGTNAVVNALCVFDDGSGPALFAGGNFTSAGGAPAHAIAKWDGVAWSSLDTPGEGALGEVLALAVFDYGTGPGLYVGGEFTVAGGTGALHIARWDGATWFSPGTLSTGVDDAVLALTSFDDGSGSALFVGGRFTTAGFGPASRIARWDGTNWSALGTGTNGEVGALIGFDDGSGAALYAGGAFTIAGGVDAPNIAKWDGASWSALGTVGDGTNAPVLALQSFDDGSDGNLDLFVGGRFTTAGTTTSSFVAAWRGCAHVPVPYCFGDGSGDRCPCDNDGSQGRGCENSLGTGGAKLTASGSLVPDALVLTQQGELTTSLSIFLQGDAEVSPSVPFGDGLRCTAGVLKRLYVANASAGSVSAPQPGDPSVTARSALLGDPIAPGSTRHYQVYYRDPNLSFCPGPQGSSFNAGNALRVLW